MDTSPGAIAPFYEGWEGYQRLLLDAITPLTLDQLQLRVAPEQWSLSILLRHLVGARVWWFHYWMGEGDNEVLARYDGWDDDMEAQPSANELVVGLETTWQMVQQALQRWTVADMPQAFPHPTNPTRPDRTRQWIIWHVLEHDIHHGGEISLVLGTHGLPSLNL